MRIKILTILIFIFFLGSTLVSADIISINSGGDLGIVINPGKLIEGFFLGEFDSLKIITDTFNGVTTTFSGLSEAEFSNMNSLTLEKTSFGKVVFSEVINLVQVAGVDRIVDFDTDLNISDNLVYIDSPDLPYMNKSATVSIYGLTFTDPQIIKGDVLCADCTEISYSSGTLIFTTTNFYSAYYTRENPDLEVCGDGTCDSGETTETCPADCPLDDDDDGGGGGGGGGGGTNVTTNVTTNETVVDTRVPQPYDFSIEPEVFVLNMNRGEYFQKNIVLTNTGLNNLSLSVGVSGVNNFVFPQKEIINLEVGQSETLRLDVYVSESRPIDVYIGKISFSSPQISKDSRVILDVKEKNALFDIKTDVLKRYISPGGRVRANITIINMGNLRNFDVSLEYRVVDFDGNNYTIKKEDFAMDKNFFNIFLLELPKDIPVGDYVFYSRVNYGDVSASSFDTFSVERLSWIVWLIIIIVLLLIIFLVIRRLRRDKRVIRKAFKEKEYSRTIKPKLIRRTLRIPKLPEY